MCEIQQLEEPKPPATACPISHRVAPGDCPRTRFNITGISAEVRHRDEASAACELHATFVGARFGGPVFGNAGILSASGGGARIGVDVAGISAQVRNRDQTGAAGELEAALIRARFGGAVLGNAGVLPASILLNDFSFRKLQ
ncbi:hypothetical protein K438DRAFT_1762863 [Mycena galopus ATCC 62051]|nr:hypothetical protein K438DRAFT_1762863 [Mycena galopus ATCC 62051]